MDLSHYLLQYNSNDNYNRHTNMPPGTNSYWRGRYFIIMHFRVQIYNS